MEHEDQFKNILLTPEASAELWESISNRAFAANNPVVTLSDDESKIQRTYKDGTIEEVKIER